MLYTLVQDNFLLGIKVLMTLLAFLLVPLVAAAPCWGTSAKKSGEADDLSRPLTEEETKPLWTSQVNQTKRMLIIGSLLGTGVLFAVSDAAGVNVHCAAECKLTRWGAICPPLAQLYPALQPLPELRKTVQPPLRVLALGLGPNPSALLPQPNGLTSNVLEARKWPCLLALTVSIVAVAAVTEGMRLLCNMLTRPLRPAHPAGRSRERDHLLRWIFWPYYAFLNFALYVFADNALIYGFVDSGSGVDWELWILWVLFLGLVQMLSVLVASLTSRQAVPSACSQMLSGYLPIIGADWHVVKDHIFVALSLQQAQCASGWLSSVFSALAYLQLTWLYGHVLFYFGDKHVERALLQSHLPYVPAVLSGRAGEEQKSEGGTAGFLGQEGLLDHIPDRLKTSINVLASSICGLVVSASTKDKEARAFYAEVPMAVFGTVFVLFGTTNFFVILGVALALAKWALAPLLREYVVPKFLLLEFLSDADFVKWVTNVQSSAEPLQIESVMGSTPLHSAARRGRAAAARALLDAAAEHGLVEEFLLAGDDPEASEDGDMGNFTPLHHAAKGGHAAAASVLLDAAAEHGLGAKALRSMESRNHLTPLHHAAKGGHVAAVRVLLDAAAEHGLAAEALRGMDAWVGPLYEAETAGQWAVARLLLDAAPEHGVTVAELLEDAVRYDGADRQGWTPLHLAARCGSAAAVRTLLDAAAERGLTAEALRAVDDCNGLTPLHVAAKWGGAASVRALLDAAAEHGLAAEALRAEDRNGLTPLRVADGEAVAVLQAEYSDSVKESV